MVWLSDSKNIVRGCDYSFLLRDAMHKRGLCRHAVSVCPSICVSVTFVNSVKTNKHIIKYFYRRLATPL